MMYSTKILKETDYIEKEDFEKEISSFLNKGFEIKEFNTVIRQDRFPKSVILLIKKEKKDMI